MSAINEYLKRLASIFGSMGFSVPPDDFSGVVIDGKTYPVMMRNDGCYVYFDDKGVKRLVSEVPKKDYQFINIKDARVSIVNQCYRTPGGQVEARIHTYMNNKGEILAEKIFIINSSDIDTPIGTELDKIPAEWVAIDCSIAEMTDRELIFVSKCYATEGGKVQIEGVESVDPRLNPEVSHYEVVNTTDDSNPIGTKYNAIPDTWRRIVCDFPDMTQREIIPVLKCFDTGTGRVQIEGYKIFDYEMGTRKEWYRVKQSTDPENPVGEFITSISDDWVEVVCDFTDMEDRDIEVTIECYKTPAGKVKLEVLTSWDGNIGVRDKSYKVLETTDPSQPEGASFSSLPDTWIRVVCDFDDMEERDIKSYIECYDSGSGNVKLRRMVSYDSKIKARYTRFEVVDSDNADFVPGAALATLPDGFSLVPCDFVDFEDRMLQSRKECYNTDKGRVQVLRITSYDGDIDIRGAVYVVTRSENPDILVDRIYNAIPGGWDRMVCEMEDMEDRDIESFVECYDSGEGNVKVRRVVSYDAKANERHVRYEVLDSDNGGFAPGQRISTLPTGWSLVSCDFTDMEDRMPIDIEECYKTSAGSVRMRHVVSYDGDLGKRNQFWEIVDSSDNKYGLGNRINDIPADFIRERCALERLDDRITRNAVECYSTPGGSVRIKSTYVINPLNHVRSYNHHVLSSTDNDIHVGTQYPSLPSNFTRIECEEPDYMDRLIDTTETCYDTGKGTVKIRRQESLNGNLDVKTFDYKIVESTDTDHPINTTPTQTVINGWTVISCDLNIMDVDDCYEIGGHKIHLKGFRTVNPALQDIKSKLYVVYLALLSWLVYVKPVNIKAMVKVCNDYYMIDALAGGEVIRKRKYRRENTMIGYKWYDYNGIEVTDPIEISRLDGLATKHQRVDEAYDDHAIFMSSTNYVNSVSGIPMDKHMVVVEWRPDSEQGFVTMAHNEGLDGDSYYIVVINAGDKQATIYTPVDSEATWFASIGTGKCSFELVGYKGGTMSQDGYNFINTGGSVVYQNTYDFVCHTGKGSSTYKTSYEKVARVTYNKLTNEVYMSIGDAIDQEDNYDKLEREINNIKERLSDVESELAVVRRIAEGKNAAYIFDTVDAMNEWLAVPENTAKLRVGDSFWIREQKVPDYWWDGTQALEQEGPKVDLSPYYTKDEINNIVNDINQKIEDKSTSIIFDTYIQMKSFVDDPTNADKLKEGTILLIRQKNVPDYYYDGAGIVKMEADVEQCLYVTLANKPTESTISYTQDREVTNFAPGAIARWVDADGNNVFYKLVEIVGGKAKWITLIDTRYGNVTLQSTYDKNYEIVNIVSGSRLQAINSDKDEIKFVNSATGNVTVVFNATVSGGAKKLTSLLAVNEVVLTPGAAASFTRTGENFTLSDLFGVTIFPDLADANREGEWVMSVGITGKPTLMEVKEMRKWDESITKELTIDELNEKFPNVDIGFAVVCKTINKVYEMVNGYKEWVSYDITSIN